MTVDVQVETTIARPPAEVAAYAGDPTNAPEWYVNIKSVGWETPPPVAIGSRMDFVAQFLGRRLAYTYEVADLDPGAAGDAHRRRTLPDGNHLHVGAGRREATRMTLRNRGNPSGFSRLTAPADGARDAAGHHQGPGPAEGAARAPIRPLATTSWGVTTSTHSRGGPRRVGSSTSHGPVLSIGTASSRTGRGRTGRWVLSGARPPADWVTGHPSTPSRLVEHRPTS